MVGPLLLAAMVIGALGETLIAGVVRRTSDRVLGGALGAGKLLTGYSHRSPARKTTDT